MWTSISSMQNFYIFFSLLHTHTRVCMYTHTHASTHTDLSISTVSQSPCCPEETVHVSGCWFHSSVGLCRIVNQTIRAALYPQRELSLGGVRWKGTHNQSTQIYKQPHVDIHTDTLSITRVSSTIGQFTKLTDLTKRLETSETEIRSF